MTRIGRKVIIARAVALVPMAGASAATAAVIIRQSRGRVATPKAEPLPGDPPISAKRTNHGRNV